MKKNLFIAALSALTLAACTNDEVIDKYQDEIKFAVTTETSTRAGAVATTTNSIKQFKLWAVTNDADKKVYINGDVISRNDAGSEWTSYTTEHFWPTSKLNFYAVSPASVETTITGAKQEIADYVVDGNTDLLYSAKMDQGKTSNNDPVALNFRHGLAQLCFAATNNNEHLGVEIAGVSVAQIYTKGTLTFPNASTDSNLTSQTTGTENPATAWGVWGSQSTIAATPVEAEMNLADGQTGIVINTPGGMAYTNNVDWLTPYVNESGDAQAPWTYFTEIKGLYVLPQTLQWADLKNWKSGETQNKAYFIISCKVWNKTGDAELDKNPVYLWGSSTEYANVAVPVVIADDDATTTDTFTWKQGTRYLYQFNFAEGAGSIVPDDPNNPGEPVLVPIKVSVTVDEFQLYDGNTALHPDMAEI